MRTCQKDSTHLYICMTLYQCFNKYLINQNIKVAGIYMEALTEGEGHSVCTGENGEVTTTNFNLLKSFWSKYKVLDCIKNSNIYLST